MASQMMFGKSCRAYKRRPASENVITYPPILIDIRHAPWDVLEQAEDDGAVTFAFIGESGGAQDGCIGS
jgi:hypothetical protein